MLIQMILIQVITFTALIYVLRRLMYTGASEELKRLQQLNQEGVEKIEELNKRASEAEREYQEKLVEAEEKSRNLKIEAKEEAEKIKEEILGKAKNESERIVKMAFNAKNRIRKEIVSQMQEDAAFLAVRLFKETLFPKAKEASHQELIGEVIKELETMDKAKFNIKIERVELFSAFSLEKSEKDKILSSVFEKLGYKVSFDEKEDKKLIAGIIIKLGTFVIDGSLNNRLRQAGERLKTKAA